MDNIAICSPVRDHVHSEFAWCLNNLTTQLTKDKIQHNVYFENGSILPRQRHTLVQHALENNHTHILWLDSDMAFPRHLLHSLLEHNLSVVGCTYSTRHEPYQSVAFIDQQNLQYRLDAQKGLHQVFALGFGALLCSIEVFQIIPKPWFMFEYDYQNQDFVGEDIYFCSKLKDFDIDIFVDVDTSKQCSHLGTKKIKLEM